MKSSVCRSSFAWTLFAIVFAWIGSTSFTAGFEVKNSHEIGPLVGLGFPDGDIVGDDDEFDPTGVVGVRYQYFFCKGNLALFGDTTRTEYRSGGPLGNVEEIAWRGGVKWYLGGPERANWHIDLGAGALRFDPATDEAVRRAMFSTGFGQRFVFGAGALEWELRGDFSRGHAGFDGEKLGSYKALAGWFWGFGGPPNDSDADGIPDCRDECDATPQGAKVDPHGCPNDSDGDSVADGLDACPNTPRGTRIDSRGCPLDSDGDGVSDDRDECPNTPRGAAVDSRGCSDSDGDGVNDGADRCPNTPRGVRVDASGCPTDSDGDGVFDGSDRCPNTPRGARVDANGCPEEAKAAPLFTPEHRSLVLEGIAFDTDSAHIRSDSTGILDRVAQSLKDYPDVRVEVGGHTDSSGGDAHNLELSQARAEAVVYYLTSHGVPAALLSAKGYGETKPVADNTTKEGKARNRRVELTKTN